MSLFSNVIDDLHKIFLLIYICFFNNKWEIFNFFFFVKNEEEKETAWKYSPWQVSTMEISQHHFDLKYKH